MSKDTQIKMEEVEDAEEDELLGGEEIGEGDVEGDVDETAEDLMTDMKLEDEMDEIRTAEPNFGWTFHIEVYPWNADDMTDAFVRLVKLAHFTQVNMRKKSSGKECDASSEKVEDKLLGRQRKGCLHLYTDSWLNARSIMRSATWKSMASKELMFEITRRYQATGRVEKAYLELDTYSASKTRFREKAKGELKDRSAKVSNLPGTISREFLDVVFCRAYAVIGGTSLKEYLKDKESNSQQQLQDIEDFDGSVDFDCLARGSCRAFVLAHKSVFIDGQKVSVVANDKETMVVPPCTHNVGVKKEEPELSSNSTPATGQSSGGRGAKTFRGRGAPVNNMGNLNVVRGVMKDSSLGRGRGLGRALLPPQRPISAPFTRPGPGMPIPMTGRQKMNEKMKRNNFGMTAAGGGGGGGLFPVPGGTMSVRASVLGSVGDSFKQEIASLQSQLERNTQELEAKIAMLQHTTQSPAGVFYQAENAEFQSGMWDEVDFDYGDEYTDQDFYLQDGTYSAQDMPSFQFKAPAQPLRRPRPVMATQNMGFSMNPRLPLRPSGSSSGQGIRRGGLRGMRRGGGSARNVSSGYW